MAYKVYSNDSLAAGSDVLDFDADITGGMTVGFVICDGDGSILISSSENGSDYGDDFELKSGETLSFTTNKHIPVIKKLKIKYNVAESSYRCMANW